MEKNRVKLILSNQLKHLLERMIDDNSYVAFELLHLDEPDAQYYNGLNIQNVNLIPGRTGDFTFKVKIGNKYEAMKIGKFIRYYFPGIFQDSEITIFVNAFNKYKNGGKTTEIGKRIPVERFNYDPTNVRSTFLSLVTKTYPHGHEEEVLEFLPELDKDKFGNYYKIIGSDKLETMFTSHLDTADRDQRITTLYSRQEGTDEIIYTDGSTILGADDKSGVAVMLYMMHHNIPGLYYFFIGEERGGIGSHMLSSEYESIDYLKEIKRCISFDRRRTCSVITQQMGTVCCSNVFGSALCEEYNKNGLNLSIDPTGVYTDSASFIDNIPECTNISVGYENEHTGSELQNITYLEKLCKASIKVNWEKLPTTRKVGFNQDLIKKHKKMIDEIKKCLFENEVRIFGFDDKVYIRIDLDDSLIQEAYDTLILMQDILYRYKVDDDVSIEGTYIKIELN